MSVFDDFSTPASEANLAIQATILYLVSLGALTVGIVALVIAIKIKKDCDVFAKTVTDNFTKVAGDIQTASVTLSELATAAHITTTKDFRRLASRRE